MKWTALLFFIAGLLPAQQYYTGQAARLLIGQPYWSAQNDGVSDRLLGAISGISYANGTLYVADSNRLGGLPNNNRILIYKNLSRDLPRLRDSFPVNDVVRCPVCVGVGTSVLGQVDFETTRQAADGSGLDGHDQKPANNTLRAPTAIHSNGRMLAVADTDYNRVLVWRTIPENMNQPADLVLGQPDFTTVTPGISQTKMRGPGGVFLDASNGLWVADTGNNRVLYFGTPNANGQQAQLVLGQPNFTSDLQPKLVSEAPVTRADTLLTPISVSSDGQRFFVADLGHNRVLIWNSIPSRNTQAADVVLGQKDFTSMLANDVENLCESNGTDKDGKATYPARCIKTMSFPRFALSDGTRLYVADGGNDRVLIYNTIPTANSTAPDVILGQQDEFQNASTDSGAPERVSASDSFKTPVALAHDGTNLYVSDTYNRRVMVFTPADFNLPLTAVRNAASLEVYAVGSIQFTHTDFVSTDTKTYVDGIEEGDVVTIRIGVQNEDDDDNVADDDGNGEDETNDEDHIYTYTTVAGDTLRNVIEQLVNKINAGNGDSFALAIPNYALDTIILTARKGGADGNLVTYAASAVGKGHTKDSPVASEISFTVAGASLSGGQNAARVAPYSLVSILGPNFSEEEGDAPLTATLPREIANVQVYFDGVRAPMQQVQAEKVTAQIPAEFAGATSASAVVRVQRKDGTVMVSSPVAVLLIPQNPGVYAEPGDDPRPAIAVHASSSATATVAVDGTAQGGDTGTIYINERPYKYTVSEVDSLETVTSAFINLINASDPEVTASRAVPFTTIRLRAKIPGPAGNGIRLRTEQDTGASLILTALNSSLCCANIEGAPITQENPAVAGGQIIVYATGLGLLTPQQARDAMKLGEPYAGPEGAQPLEFVSSLIGGKTARVITCNLLPGAVGVYAVTLELNPDLITNPVTQGTIAQSYQISNIFTLPVVHPSGNQ